MKKLIGKQKSAEVSRDPDVNETIIGIRMPHDQTITWPVKLSSLRVNNRGLDNDRGERKYRKCQIDKPREFERACFVLISVSAHAREYDNRF